MTQTPRLDPIRRVQASSDVLPVSNKITAHNTHTMTSNVTGHQRSENGRHVTSAITTMHIMLQLFVIVECGIVHFHCTMHVFEGWASSSPLGYLCTKFRFCGNFHC